MSVSVTTSGAARLLVAEDDASMRAVLRFNLEEEGYDVVIVGRGDDAIALLPAGAGDRGAQPPFDLVITDVKMPGADGVAVLAAARACHPDIQIVLVTAFGSVDAAIEAIALGAADYVTKPFKRAELKARVRQALDRARLARENRNLRLRVEAAGDASQIISRSQRMNALLDIVDRVAPSDITVLISGESGTGKELVARRLHAVSGRRGAFVPVNCAALPANLLESELFGHERGAFTGADRRHRGRFESADGGTLFLDEIGELPIELQAKILRVLEEGVVDRVGSQSRLTVDVRVVAASNRDLAAEVAAGRFREDLFHRLSVVPLHVAPLRERSEDVEVLALAFLAAASDEPLALAPALVDELRSRPWPGNVRELKNLILRMAVLRRGLVLDLADLAPPGGAAISRDSAAVNAADAAVGGSGHGALVLLVPGALRLPDAPFCLPDLEREIVLKALERHGGNQSATARYLGIPRHVLIYRLDRYEREGGEGPSDP